MYLNYKYVAGGKYGCFCKKYKKYWILFITHPPHPGRVLVGQGNSDYGVTFNNGNMGGEYNHTLSKDELPSFSFTGTTNRAELIGKFSAARKEQDGVYHDPIGIVSLESKSGTGWRTGTWHDNEMGNFRVDASHGHTFTISYNSSNKSFNTISPYLVVYIWKRIL